MFNYFSVFYFKVSFWVFMFCLVLVFYVYNYFMCTVYCFIVYCIYIQEYTALLRIKQFNLKKIYVIIVFYCIKYIFFVPKLLHNKFKTRWTRSRFKKSAKVHFLIYIRITFVMWFCVYLFVFYSIELKTLRSNDLLICI